METKPHIPLKPAKAAALKRRLTKYGLGRAHRIYNKERDNRERPSYIAIIVDAIGAKGRELLFLTPKQYNEAKKRAERNPEDAERILYIEENTGRITVEVK